MTTKLYVCLDISTRKQCIFGLLITEGHQSSSDPSVYCGINWDCVCPGYVVNFLCCLSVLIVEILIQLYPPMWMMTGRTQSIFKIIPYHFQVLIAKYTIPGLIWSHPNDMWCLLAESLFLSVSLHYTPSVPVEFFRLTTVKDSGLWLCYLMLCCNLFSLIAFSQINWENSFFGLIYGNELVG